MSQIFYIRTRDNMKRPDFKITDMVAELDQTSDEYKQLSEVKIKRQEQLSQLSHEMTSFIKERNAEVAKLQVKQLSCHWFT